MTFKRTFLTVIVFMSICDVGVAQLQIPAFDAELKFNQTLMPGDGRYEGDIEFIEATGIHLGAHVIINQHLAIGGFYSRSFRGVAKINSIDNQEIQLLQKGFDVRVSTSRAKKWRHYLDVSYSINEIVQQGESLRLADKFNAIGFSYGIMRRLSNNLYLNVIELGARMRTGEPIWFASGMEDIDIFMDAKIGLIYNIGKRK